MKTMMRCLCLLAIAGVLVASAADLAGVHSVYLLPMARGMDQYLAIQLTNEHLFKVVTDPKLADAVFTDHISEGFQEQLEDFSPTPKPPKPPKADEGTAAKAADSDAKDKPGDEAHPRARSDDADAGDKAPAASRGSGMFAPAENKLSNPASSSGFSRAHGTLFLVDAKSRQVIWSIYAPPKDFAGKEMNRTASDIVSRLKRDLNPKK